MSDSSEYSSDSYASSDNDHNILCSQFYSEPQIIQPVTKDFYGQIEELINRNKYKQKVQQCPYQLDDGVVNLNHDFINSTKCDIVNLNYSGNYEQVDIANISKITQKVEKISLRKASVNLSQLNMPVNKLLLLMCKINGSWGTLFSCDELTVIINERQDTNWISQANYVQLTICFTNFSSQLYSVLQKCSVYQNLQQISITESTINLQLITWFIKDLTFRECKLVGNASLNVNNLCIIDCELTTSQLLNSKINSLTLQNVYDGSIDCYDSFEYETFCTTINDVPDVNILIISDCLFKLRSTSAPKANQLDLKGVNSGWVPFSFFANINKINSRCLSQYVIKYKQLSTNQEQIRTQNYLKLTDLRSGSGEKEEIVKIIHEKINEMLKMELGFGAE
ncbi:Hypothetical_protein [Hexamita inflata]|uniref:Hypothetical_protein n=1 Tax=Hexamita inflata TaxID=28002 RepID=A0AA86RDZ8_9EUKA|nr:Hypothetical protein HINF_LOCUS59966 [Hexamita inflata]